MLFKTIVQRSQLLTNKADGVWAQRLVIDVHFDLHNDRVNAIEIKSFQDNPKNHTFATHAKLSDTSAKKIQSFMLECKIHFQFQNEQFFIRKICTVKIFKNN